MTTTFDALDALVHPRIQERRVAVDQHRQRRLKFRAGAVALVGMLALAAVAVIGSPMLDVNEVRVIGASPATAAAVASVIEVGAGAPLIGLDLADDTDRVAELLAVQSATLTKDWSGTVSVEIVERVPVARLDIAGGSIAVSADGLVLVKDSGRGLRGTADSSAAAARVDPTLPRISGAMLSTEVGRWVPTELDDALRVAENLPADIATVVDAIAVSVAGLDLQMTGGATIGLADSRDLDQKLDAVRAFLAHVDLSCVDHIDVSAPHVPVLARTANCR